MKRLRFSFIVLVFITSFVFSAIFHPVIAQEETIILISTPEELAKIGNHEDYPLNGYYQLTNDIDIGTFGNWTPIGTRYASFSGTFDGDGHTISKLTVNDPMSDYKGLFGVIGISGNVRNLQMTSANVDGHIYLGLLAGRNYGSITKVAVHGVVSGARGIGGLVADNRGMITNSYAIATITGSAGIGGLVSINNDEGIINTSYSASYAGHIVIPASGGLVGINDGTVFNSYYDSTVSGRTDTTKGGIPLTTAQMKSESSFSTWDFSNTWHIIEGETYPSLFPISVTIERVQSQPDPSPTEPINFIVTFDEPINKASFISDDIIIGGTSGVNHVEITEISPNNGTTFKLTVSGMINDGIVSVSIPDGKVIDNLNNFNIDTTPPTVSISSTIVSPTNSSTIPITITFSEEVTEFTIADISVTKGSASNFLGSGISYTVDITPLEDGLIKIEIPENSALDLAGNPNVAATPLEITYDTQSPLIIRTNIEKYYEGNPPDHLEIIFSEAMYNPQGDSDPDDVTNPANYLLVEWGGNSIFDTTSCKDGWQEDDQLIKISSVTYDEETFVSTLTLPNKLSEGSYRLFVCGSATLYDAAMNPFNNGLDSIYSFIVLSEAEEEEENEKTSQSPTLLPETGFPVGQTTLLAKQQANQQYASTILELEIPGAGIRTSIVGVPFVAGDWDVSWLGKQAGYLYGSAYPTWQGNTVLTGHVWNANNTPGIFFNLKTLKYGDLIRIHAYGMVYTYEVRENRLIAETNLKAAFQSEDHDWVTLLTCEGYQPNDKSYGSRRMVRAVLVSVE